MDLRSSANLTRCTRAAALAVLTGLLVWGGAPAPVQANVRSLLKHVPESAQAVVAVDLGSIALLKQFFTRIPEMKRELSGYLRRTVGLDLTEFNGAAVFVTRTTPEPRGAVFIRLKRGGTLRGRRIAGHRGIKIVSVEGKKLVAAAVRGGLVLGDLTGVKQVIDLAKGKARPLGVRSPLAEVLSAARGNVQLIAGVNAAGIPEPQVQQMARRFGVKVGLLTFDSRSQVKLQVLGEMGKMRMALAMLEQLITMTEKQLLAEKKRATAKDEVLPAVGAIMGYHQWRSFIAEARPRERGGRIVSTYKVPKMGSPLMLTSVVGILAAVAIPAFVKYTRKAKTVEAMEAMDKIMVGAKVYFQADHYDRQGKLKKKTFPLGKTGWVPRRSCCKQPGGKCKGAARVWAREPWKSLYFSLTDDHYYQYRYTSRGQDKKATFMVEARGDLDCDGTYSSFKLRGMVDHQGAVNTTGPMITHELE